MKLIAHAGQEAPVTTPDGAQRRVLSYGDNLMLVQFTFEAGVASWTHSHPHAQVGYVVSGEIDFIMEGSPPVRLAAGGSYYVPPSMQPSHRDAYAYGVAGCLFTHAQRFSGGDMIGQTWRSEISTFQDRRQAARSGN